MKNLLKTIPSLDAKLSEMENLTSEFPPMSNISENIKKIKDLIEQARDAANRVRPHSRIHHRVPNQTNLSSICSFMGPSPFCVFSPDWDPHDV